jgi:hypothetical protein
MLPDRFTLHVVALASFVSLLACSGSSPSGPLDPAAEDATGSDGPLDRPSARSPGASDPAEDETGGPPSSNDAPPSTGVRARPSSLITARSAVAVP